MENLTREIIEGVIQKSFSGEISQIPPLYSASRIDGQRGYVIARKGDDAEMKSKIRTILDYQITRYSWPSFTAKITVSHGTYIRSLARDIGIQLGTGGYVEKLERISIGHISLESFENWIQHNDIFYAPLSHEMLFPEIEVLEMSDAEKKHLRLWSTPLSTNKKNNHYFVVYEDGMYGLLEARDGSLFPIKNCV